MGNRKRNPGKVLKFLFGVCICLILWGWNVETAQAYESKSSYLRVGGTFMVKDGMLKEDTVQGNQGTAIYDEKTNTLLLTDFKSTKSIAIQHMSGLKIKLKGVNELSSDNNVLEAGQKGAITICGGGTLKITAGTKDSTGDGIKIKNHSFEEGQTDLYIEDCTLDITASARPIFVEDSLEIKNSRLVLRGTELEGDHMDFYYRKTPYPGMSSGALKIASSALDIQGMTHALDIKEKPIYGPGMTLTDAKGGKLNLAKMNWPSLQTLYPDSTMFWYVYSKFDKEWIYSFDGAEKHVVFRYEPKEEKPSTPATPEKPTAPSRPDTKDTGKTTRKYKAGSLYYTGKLASGKLSCIGPVNKKVSTATIPSSVKINGYTCKVTSIGKKAFKNCTNLKTVKIGSSVTSIGTEAFCNCRKLKSVTFGKNIKTISEKAFYKCTALTKVFLPSKTSAIKKGTFAHCSSLKSVRTGNGVASIGADAFYNCKKLSTLSLGKNLTTISDRAFYQCSALKTVTFPAKVKYIRKEAFRNCTKLKTITFRGKTLKSVGSGAFRGTAKKAKVTIPKSRYASYRKILKGKGLRSPVYRKQ